MAKVKYRCVKCGFEDFAEERVEEWMGMTPDNKFYTGKDAIYHEPYSTCARCVLLSIQRLARKIERMNRAMAKREDTK